LACSPLVWLLTPSTTMARSGPSSRCISNSPSRSTAWRRSRRSTRNGTTRSRSPR